MHPQTHCVRCIDPFHNRVKEDDEFEFLEEGFLFLFQLAGLRDGE
jgi:hypothetical protein